MTAARKDVKGRRFGRLVAIADAGPSSDGPRIWHCECDCGGFVKAKVNALLSGQVRSCGCLYRDTRKNKGWGLTQLYGVDP